MEDVRDATVHVTDEDALDGQVVVRQPDQPLGFHLDVVVVHVTRVGSPHWHAHVDVLVGFLIWIPVPDVNHAAHVVQH
jgi:hypothetical protein